MRQFFLCFVITSAIAGGAVGAAFAVREAHKRAYEYHGCEARMATPTCEHHGYWAQ